MRIISGLARGMKLTAPKKAETRPTTDRVREALFNILAGDVVEARFLDLFAGSGGVGIEALSRGAEHCVFVDRHHECIDCIRRNLEKARLDDSAKLLRTDAYNACSNLPDGTEGFDIVYVDPPYRDARRAAPGSRLLKLLAALPADGLLNADALVIVEHDNKANLPDELPGLDLTDQRAYGDTVLSFYAAITGEEGD